MNKHIAHETTLCRNPPTHSFTGDGKKLDISFIDQHVSMLWFYEDIRRKFFLSTSHFDKRYVCNSTV